MSIRHIGQFRNILSRKRPLLYCRRWKASSAQPEPIIKDDTSTYVNKSRVVSELHKPSLSSNTQIQIEEDTNMRGARHPDIDLSFENCREAYKSKTTPELLRSLFVLKLCSYDWVVTHNKKLMQISRKVLGRRLFEYVMRSTFYGQFVAGPDEVGIRPTVNHIRRFGVKSILDYSAEKDISNEDAKKAEEKGSRVGDEVAETTGQYPEFVDSRYRYHEEFADRRDKVISARTYFYEDEAKCDECMEVFIRSIDAVAGSTQSSGFAAIKLTALGRPQFLLQMSEILVHLRRLFEIFAGRDDCGLAKTTIESSAFKKRLEEMGIEITSDERHKWFTILDRTGDGQIDLLDWHNLLDVKMNLVKVLQIRKAENAGSKPVIPMLNDMEIKQLENMLRRINTVVEHARKKDVRLMVDAEQTYFQPAISRFTMEMMRKFNTEKAIVFNTYQCYLKNTLDTIRIDLALSRREGFYFGAKLVRGAYMEQERLRAQSVGYEDPINRSYEATTEMYELVVDEVMNQMKMRPKGEIGVMLATHNEGSVRMAIQKMRSHGIMPRDKLVCFGQLYGMCDQVTFTLGQAGYSVYKYMPFGPVDEVIPYLSRRAMENRGVIKKAQKERRLMREELRRRYKKGNLRYNPLVHPITPPI